MFNQFPNQILNSPATSGVFVACNTKQSYNWLLQHATAVQANKIIIIYQLNAALSGIFLVPENDYISKIIKTLPRKSA
jgi:hypothetical protein